MHTAIQLFPTLHVEYHVGLQIEICRISVQHTNFEQASHRPYCLHIQGLLP